MQRTELYWALTFVALFARTVDAQPNVPPPTQPPGCTMKGCPWVPPPPRAPEPYPPELPPRTPPPLAVGPAGAESLIITHGGFVQFDYEATVVWSRYAVSEYLPPGRPVYVATYVNGPGGPRLIWMLAWEPNP